METPSVVEEEVKLGDVKIVSDDVEVKEVEKPSVLSRLVPPHTLKSRQVTEADIERVVEESKILYEICLTDEGMGIYRGAYAMHHSQIDDKDPLDFFVTHEKKIVINPKALNHSNYFTNSKEGCVTFAGRERVIVPRWHKLEVEYVTLMSDPDNEGKFKFSSPVEEFVTSLQSFIFQHEMGHGNAEYIFPLSEPVVSMETLDPKFKGIGRNETCPCGSGKKFKKCHLQ